ncbi:MAG: CheY-like chemotaxis protein [Cyclobacteriaceae bacterium]|jgi:CheY-like chemotaxis protein
MHGDIRVKSSKGQGSTFEFDVTNKVNPDTKLIVLENDLSALSILIIDDTRTALTATKNQLQAWDATCFCANNTEEALQIINDQGANTFDKVMVDNSLMAEDKALKPSASTAILLVVDNEINREIAQGIINDLGLECATAENGSDALSKLESYAMSEAKELCIKAGMNDYLSKPVDTVSLQYQIWDEAAALRRMRNKPERLLVMAICS